MDPSITTAMERGGREWGQVPDCIREALLSLNDCISDLQKSQMSQRTQQRYSRSSRSFSPGDPHSAARAMAHTRSRQRTASEKRMRQSKISQQMMEMHRSAKLLSSTASSLLREEPNEPPAIHEVYSQVMNLLFNHFVSAAALIQWTVANFSTRQDFLHLGIPKHFYQSTEEKRSYFQFSPSDPPQRLDPSTDKLINEFDKKLAEARQRPPRRPVPEFDEVTPVRERERRRTNYSNERRTPTRGSNVSTPKGYSQRRPPTPTRSPSPSVASVRNDSPSRKSSRSSMASHRRKEAERQEAEQQRLRELQHEIDLENERLRVEEERKAKIQSELERQQADEIEELLEASRKLSRRSRVTNSESSKASKKSNTPPASCATLQRSNTPPASSRESSVSIPQAGNLDIAEGGKSPHSEKESIRREKISPDDDDDSDCEMISKRTTLKMDMLSENSDEDTNDNNNNNKNNDSDSDDDGSGPDDDNNNNSDGDGDNGGGGGPDDSEGSNTIEMQSPPNVRSDNSSTSSTESNSIDIPMATKNRLNDSESDDDDDDGGLKWG
eukprot:TRINITY_DN4581_c0_g1_i1.p1 TRINITY_DN4581_c0_g1~~TRINITY_DN4581_c0_g1_i1.p1  ORF type:complete len:554 (+),score=156.92 TRINITY_DN4581_c0_g1_i1:39-1700(+)